MRTTPDGKGVISVLELSDVMAKPRLFSTFMLWMLAQLYQSLPEAGDLPKPKLAFFFDEAHLLFDDASEALMDQVELTVRLIRSKGVGVYFVTQAPTDVPSSVLSQLGNRVQHALRAFTPDDADDLRKTARTFPMTDPLRRRGDDHLAGHRRGAGDRAVAPGRAHAARRDPAPAARLADGVDPARPTSARVAAGPLTAKYATAVDRESAHEIISRQLDGGACHGGCGRGCRSGRRGDDDGGRAQGRPEGAVDRAGEGRAGGAQGTSAGRARGAEGARASAA